MGVAAKRQSRRRSPYSAPNVTVEDMLARQHEFNQAGTNFLKADVMTALTFSQAALTSDDPEKKQRNRKFARKAYDTVVKMMQNVTLTEADVTELQENLQQVKSDLVTLGEVF